MGREGQRQAQARGDDAETPTLSYSLSEAVMDAGLRRGLISITGMKGGCFTLAILSALCGLVALQPLK